MAFVVAAVILAAVFAAAVFAAPVAGNTAPQVFVSLEYQTLPGAAGCADASGFRAGVQNQLGYDPFRSQAERHVAVRVWRGEGGYEGRIQWTDAQGRDVGQRRLTTRRAGCADIVNNVAFAVAVQIQLLGALGPPRSAPGNSVPPSARAEAAPPTASPPTPAETTEKLPPERIASPATETPPPERTPPPVAQPAPVVASVVPPPSKSGPSPALRLSLGVGPSLALALATHPTANGRLFLEASLGSLSFELAFDATLPTRQHEAGGAGFSLHRYGAAGAACGRTQILGACVIGELGRLEANGLGVDVPQQQAGLSGQVGARVFARHDLGTRYFTALRVEGLVMLSRWTVIVNELPVWTTPRFGALIGADVGARFF